MSEKGRKKTIQSLLVYVLDIDLIDGAVECKAQLPTLDLDGDNRSIVRS